MDPDNNVAPRGIPRASSPYSTDVDLAHTATMATDETMDFEMDVDMDEEVAAMQKAAAELHAVRGHSLDKKKS